MSSSINPIIATMIDSIVNIKSNAIWLDDGFTILSEAEKLMKSVEEISRKLYAMEYEKQRGISYDTKKH